jgi:hypothetical protein
VRRNAELGMLVHLVRPYLHLERQLARTDHRGMQRAVVVLLRVRDVVVELTGDIRPAAVHEPERGVALGEIADDHAHGEHVHDLLEGDALALHLAPDAVDVFRASADLGNDSRITQVEIELAADILDIALALITLDPEPAGDAFVLFRLAVAKGEVLEFPLEMPDTQTIGERGIDFTRLERRTALHIATGRLELAHRHELQGEPHEHEADIRREREQQLAQPLGLLGPQCLTGIPAARYTARADAGMLPGQLQCGRPQRSSAASSASVCAVSNGTSQPASWTSSSTCSPASTASVASAVRRASGASACASSTARRTRGESASVSSSSCFKGRAWRRGAGMSVRGH